MPETRIRAAAVGARIEVSSTRSAPIAMTKIKRVEPTRNIR